MQLCGPLLPPPFGHVPLIVEFMRTLHTRAFKARRFRRPPGSIIRRASLLLRYESIIPTHPVWKKEERAIIFVAAAIPAVQPVRIAVPFTDGLFIVREYHL